MWSIYLDLWGTIDQRNERPDKKWCFPTDFMKKLKNEEIEQVKELIDGVDLDLDKPNKNLVIDESMRNTEFVETSKDHSDRNWIDKKKKEAAKRK
jgi:hypothetical protein